ncbi:uncharacterized protein LOC136090961 [Hydra vulgaris]|uniref:Uncharacterized protein LOC136090961 n=1 Tax=Hydra vulgaris TaxID=6087 RepID=A0ABM4DHP8_HYDVU
MRNKQSIRNTSTLLETANSNIATDTGYIYSLLNNNFQSVFVLEPEGPMLAFESRTEAICVVNPTSFLIVVVQKCLNYVDERKSTGYDDLHPRVLSKGAATFAESYFLIYKCSFATDVVSNLWRKLNVTPFFKNKSKLDASKYLSCSLHSMQNNESTFQTSIIENSVTNGLITRMLHGFVHCKDCV